MATPATKWEYPPANADAENVLSWFRSMRELDPVQRDPAGGWHIFGYPEALSVLSNHSAFSNAPTIETTKADPMSLFRQGNLAWMDPPQHRQLRAIISQVFTPRYATTLEPMIIATAEECLAKARGKETIAIIEEYAFPVVMTVIAKMIGIPPSDHQLFYRWAKALMALIDPATARNGLLELVTSTRDLSTCLEEHIKKRRSDPQDDLTTKLISSEVDGKTLTDDEIAGLTALLLLSGNAGMQVLSNALLCLDEYPDVTQRLRSDSSLLASALEEVMRYRSQATRVSRRTLTAVTVGQHEIPAARQVSVWLWSANRDPRQFKDPDVFDVERSPNPHIAMSYGIHFCIGAPLARLESRIALEHLLSETQDFSIDYSKSRLLDPRLICGANEIALNVAWRGSQ